MAEKRIFYISPSVAECNSTGGWKSFDRVRMFISQQTNHCLRMTVHSFIEVTKFLLSEGMEYVLSERFSQDLIEEYFGHHQAQNGYGDNPTVQSFDLTIATQRIIAPVVRVNVDGHHQGDSSKWFVVSGEPLQKGSIMKIFLLFIVHNCTPF